MKKFKRVTLVVAFIFSTGILGYAFDSAIKTLGPGNNGLKSGLQMVELWHKMSSKLKIGKSAKRFFNFLDESVKKFDFMQLYESKYMSGRSGGFHTVTLRGQNLPSAYRLDLVKGSYSSVNISTFGNFGAEFGLRKVDKSIVGDRSFRGNAKFRTNLKQFSHINGTAFLEGLQKILDPTNLSKLSYANSSIYRNVKGESRSLLNAYANQLPNFSKVLHKYTSLRSLVKVKEHNGQKYTHMKMIGGLKMRALKRDFPEIYDYLEEVKGILKLRLIVNNSKGKRVTTFYLDSKNRSIVWSLYTKDGKIVPFDGKGRPAFDQAFSLAKVNRYTFYGIMNARLYIYGLKFNTKSVITRADYRRKGRNASFRLHVTRIPKPSVSGRFYHVLPTWLIDIGIPGNIEELAGKMATLMQKGNNGKGTRLNLAWNGKNASNTIVSGNGQTEIIDNRFIRFALKIWSRKMRPDDKALKELNRFQSLLTGKLLADMRRLASR